MSLISFNVSKAKNSIDCTFQNASKTKQSQNTTQDKIPRNCKTFPIKSMQSIPIKLIKAFSS